MKKIALIALATASLGAMAVPAAAQGYGRDYDRDGRVEGRWDGAWDYRHDWNRGFNINRMQRQLDNRIDRGVRRGLLTRAEARKMQSQFHDIVRLEARYRNNGLNRYERNELERRLVAFERRLDNNLRDGQYYAYRR